MVPANRLRLMKGNIYISVPAADKTNSLPASIDRYDWEEFTYDDEGEVTSMTTVHPTWEQYGEKYQHLFGAPVAVVVGEVEYIVYEIEASWLDSEVSALVALGAGVAAPSYTLMTNPEARAFIQANTPEQL